MVDPVQGGAEESHHTQPISEEDEDLGTHHGLQWLRITGGGGGIWRRESGRSAQLGLNPWQSLPKLYWLPCSPPTDLSLPAIQRHTLPAGAPGVRGRGAPGHSQPSFGPV